MNYPQDEFDKIPEGTGSTGAHRGFGAPIAAGSAAGAYSANLSADDPQYSDSYEYIYVDDGPSRKGLLPILIAGTAALVIGALAFFVVPQMFKNNSADPAPVASTTLSTDAAATTSDPYTSTWTPSTESPSSSESSSSAESSSASSTYSKPAYVPPRKTHRPTYQRPRTSQAPRTSQKPSTSASSSTSKSATPTETKTSAPASSSKAPTTSAPAKTTKAPAPSTKPSAPQESTAPPSQNSAGPKNSNANPSAPGQKK